MTGPVPPPVPLPGGVVLGPDGSLSFPGQAQEDQASGAGLAPVAPGFPQPAPRAPAPPAVGTGQFTVDLERAPQALRELENAKLKLETLRHHATTMANVIPPGADSVSRDVASLLGLTAVGGAGSLLWSINAGIDQLNGLMAKVRQDLRDYHRVDSLNSDTLT